MPRVLSRSDPARAVRVSRRRRPARALLGILVGGALVALVVALRSAGLLQGGPAAVLLCMGSLAVPTSRQLSRRILVAGAVGLGWLPMAWWFPEPLPSFGRMGLLLALIFGGLGAWVASGGSPRDRLASLVPRLRLVDALPLLTAMASAAALSHLLTARTGARVLTLLIPGWDQNSHYGMVHLIRATGSMTNPAPWIVSAGTTPHTNYPQGFHAAVAATMELLTSPTVQSAGDELVLYAHAVALVMIVAVTAVVAGLCALPRLRRRPVVAAPLVALVTAGFVWGPGAVAMQDGFPNFLVASALVGMVILLIVPLQRVISPVILVAIGGAIVGIAYSWALLLVLALFALPALVVPLSRRRWVASRPRWLAASAIMLAVILASLAALKLLATIPLVTQLAAYGAVTRPAIGIMLTTVVASVGLTVAVFALSGRAPRGATGRTTLRTAAMVLVPLGGAGIATAIAVLELRAEGTISYYFWKFAIGLELTCLVVVVVAAAALITNRPQGSSTRFSRNVAAAASGLLVLAASQTFGYVGPPLARYGVSQGDSTVQLRESAAQLAATPNRTGQRLLAAVPVQQQNPTRRVIFMPYPEDVRTHPILAEQWYLGLNGTYTDQDAALVLAVPHMPSARTAATWATKILREDPARLVVVGPGVLQSVRRAMDPALRDRVVSW